MPDTKLSRVCILIVYCAFLSLYVRVPVDLMGSVIPDPAYIDMIL